MIKNFYPTPKPLISKMMYKVTGSHMNILEPSAGKGDIIEHIKESYKRKWQHSKFSAIEIEQDFRAVLVSTSRDSFSSRSTMLPS